MLQNFKQFFFILVYETPFIKQIAVSVVMERKWVSGLMRTQITGVPQQLKQGARAEGTPVLAISVIILGKPSITLTRF